jgi:hypothetical protein
MTEPNDIDTRAVDAYRQRRAPPGFAARVAARTAPTPGPPRLFRWSAAAVGLAAGSALVFVLVTRSPAPPSQEMAVPGAPDYWAEISVPAAPPVSGLTDFGAIPQLPPRPEFDGETGNSDQRSSVPRRGESRLTLSTQQEIIHEAV